ncbi:MAG: undecaprenyl-diphosphate phosphatase [Patescibacteria group bacterium]
MTGFQAIILGLVQGLTEFLPVSSSGHLVIFQNLFGIDEPTITFDIFLHLSTLAAILVFLRKRIIKIRFETLFLVAVGTVPAIILGLLLNDYLELLFSSSKLVGITLLVTAAINFASDKLLNREGQKREIDELSWKNALVIGTFQALAITPGISRSGSTLLGGLWQKLKKEDAFEFSFLLAIPAILGATLLQIIKIITDNNIDIDPTNFFLGGITAFLSGLASLIVFRIIIAKAKLDVFAIYCLIVGALTLIFL